MFLRRSLTICLLITSYFGLAQNLVQNGGFEELRTDITGKGSLSATKYWISTTSTGADLFSNTPNPKIETVYANLKNGEKSASGEQFTGLTAYSYLAQEPRSYVSNYLKSPLTSGKKYCFKMDIMLHQRAKYQTSDLAMLVTKDDIGYDTDMNLLDEGAVKLNLPGDFEPGSWYTAHASFIASSNAQILNIGNFTSDMETKFDEIQKSKTTVLDGQLPVAYYFIDNVEIVEISSLESCGTMQDVVADNAYTKAPKRNIVEKDDFSRLPAVPEPEKIEIENIGSPEYVGDEALNQAMRDDNTLVFLDYSSGLDDKLYDRIDNLLSEFKKGDYQKLTLISRTSYDEAVAAKQNRLLRSLSSKRVASVKDYLTRKGLNENMIEVVNEPFNAAKLQGGSPTVSFLFDN